MTKQKESGSVKLADNSLKPINDTLWRFAITLGGFIVNGFMYDVVARRIIMPTCNWGNGPKKVVKAYGIHVKRLREKVEEAIGNRD